MTRVITRYLMPGDPTSGFFRLPDPAPAHEDYWMMPSGILVDTRSPLTSASDDQFVAGGGGAWTPFSDAEPVAGAAEFTTIRSDSFDQYASVLAMMYVPGTPYFCTSSPGTPDCNTTYGTEHTRYYNGAGYPCTDPSPGDATLIVGRSGSGNAIRSHINTGVSSSTWTYPNPVSGDITGFNNRMFLWTIWFRISAGGNIGSEGCKWWEMWPNPVGLGDRMQTGFNNNGITWSDAATDTGTINRSLNPVSIDGSSGANLWSQVSDGTWHRMTGMWLQNTSSTFQNTGGSTSANQTYTGTSSRDGRCAIWFDGTLVSDFQQAKVGVTPTNGRNRWCYQCDVDSLMNRGRVGHLKWPNVFGFSVGVTVAFNLDWDDMKLFYLTSY